MKGQIEVTYWISCWAPICQRYLESRGPRIQDAKNHFAEDGWHFGTNFRWACPEHKKKEAGELPAIERAVFPIRMSYGEPGDYHGGWSPFDRE